VNSQERIDRSKQSASKLLEVVESLEGDNKELHDFLAGSSLCEGCQSRRVERKIIATPRIQVEEKCEALTARVSELEAALREIDKVARRSARTSRDWLIAVCSLALKSKE